MKNEITSQIGSRNNLLSDRNIKYKYEDIKFSIGCSRGGNEMEYSEFTLSITTPTKHYRLVLNKEDADSIISFWSKQEVSPRTTPKN